MLTYLLDSQSQDPSTIHHEYSNCLALGCLFQVHWFCRIHLPDAYHSGGESGADASGDSCLRTIQLTLLHAASRSSVAVQAHAFEVKVFDLQCVAM